MLLQQLSSDFLFKTIYRVISIICKCQHIFVLLTAPGNCLRTIQAQSPQHGYSDITPSSSPCSDSACSCSDCDSEPDQVSTHSEQPPRKERQRTTFSPLEVWELERAYRQRPYLMSEDEEDLMQRLGITAKSLKVRLPRTTNSLVSN